MIVRLLVLLLLLAPATAAPARGQPIGAFFTLVNTYFYTKGPREGSRHLVRPRLAFTVVDVTVDGNNNLWYRVVYPPQSDKLSGQGWTPMAPHELLNNNRQPVPVFSRIPGADDTSINIVQVPADGLVLLNETQSSSPFAQVVWQKVRYELTQPLQAWARGGAGIYRPGKGEAFLSRVHGEMVTRDVGKEKLLRLLSGVVHIGDSLREVGWALGEPLRKQEETVGTTRRSIWQFPETTVVFENEVVKQLN